MPSWIFVTTQNSRSVKITDICFFRPNICKPWCLITYYILNHSDVFDHQNLFRMISMKIIVMISAEKAEIDPSAMLNYSLKQIQKALTAYF